MSPNQSGALNYNTLIDNYLTDGYCIVTVANTGNLLQVEEYIRSLNYGDNASAFVYSLLTFSPEVNLEISKRVIDFFKLSLQNTFKDYRFLAGSFLIKPAHTKTELLMHQDWCYVDENEYLPATCWAPLMDVDATSGGIFLIKGSHKFFSTYRSNSYETARFKLAELDPRQITYLQIKRGEILLFNPAIWHGSAPNLTGNARVAVTCLLIPETARFLYFQKQDAGTCEVLEVPDTSLELHLKNLVQNHLPDSFISIRNVSYSHPVLTASDFPVF